MDTDDVIQADLESWDYRDYMLRLPGGPGAHARVLGKVHP